jgi:pantothenate kinase-related protein Tda10
MVLRKVVKLLSVHKSILCDAILSKSLPCWVLHWGPQGVGQPDLSSALTRAAVVHGEATSKSTVEAAYRTYEAQLCDVGTAALLMLAASEVTTHTEDNLAGYALV